MGNSQSSAPGTAQVCVCPPFAYLIISHVTMCPLPSRTGYEPWKPMASEKQEHHPHCHPPSDPSHHLPRQPRMTGIDKLNRPREQTLHPLSLRTGRTLIPIGHGMQFTIGGTQGLLPPPSQCWR